jgi:phage FluMu gp28-like protein
MEHGVAHVGERRTRGADHALRHGDSAVAAALAYFASRAEPGEFSYVRVADAATGRRFAAAAADDEDRPAAGRVLRGFATGAW